MTRRFSDGDRARSVEQDSETMRGAREDHAEIPGVSVEKGC